jgi:hypothetical protein
LQNKSAIHHHREGDPNPRQPDWKMGKLLLNLGKSRRSEKCSRVKENK